jgi:two-component system cell cycle response regulator DivK
MAQNSILVVDDNPLNLKLTRILLAAHGYEVRTAMDSKEALAVLDSFQPRLILMDIQLPGMNGLELTRRLKADPSTRDIVVLALTAYAMKGDEHRAREAGCNGYIAKPIDTRSLAAVVREYLEREDGQSRAAGPKP